MAVKQSHTFFLHNVISTNTRKMSRDGTRRHMLLLIVLRKNRSYGEIRMSDEFESVGEGLRSRSLLADHGTSGPVPVRWSTSRASCWPRPLYRPSCIMVYHRHFASFSIRRWGYLRVPMRSGMYNPPIATESDTEDQSVSAHNRKSDHSKLFLF
jgi:hypothetical protein